MKKNNACTDRGSFGDRYMSLRSAAEYTDFSTEFLRRRLKHIPHVKVDSNDIRIRQSDLDAWMESFRVARQMTAREIADMVSREMGI